MGHTPGPWKVVDRLYIWTDDDWQCEVAKVCDEDQTCKLWQADDDARLIAAAPSLLAALRAVGAYIIDTKAAFIDHWGSEDEESFSNVMDWIDAAISKAEGRSE